MQRVIVALVEALNVFAIEAFVADLHPSAERAHSRKFALTRFAEKPDAAASCHESRLSSPQSPPLLVGGPDLEVGDHQIV